MAERLDLDVGCIQLPRRIVKKKQARASFDAALLRTGNRNLLDGGFQARRDGLGLHEDGQLLQLRTRILHERELIQFGRTRITGNRAEFRVLRYLPTIVMALAKLVRNK